MGKRLVNFAINSIDWFCETIQNLYRFFHIRPLILWLVISAIIAVIAFAVDVSLIRAFGIAGIVSTFLFFAIHFSMRSIWSVSICLIIYVWGLEWLFGDTLIADIAMVLTFPLMIGLTTLSLKKSSTRI